jgi:hypothetical protein
MNAVSDTAPSAWEGFEVDEAERLGINALWTDGERVLLAGSDDDGPAIWEWIP